MTQDEIIEMAKKVGFWQEHVNTWMCNSQDIEDFANLVLNKARATDVEEATFIARQQNEQMKATLQTISKIALANLSQNEL